MREAQAHGDMRIETITDRAESFLDHLARLHRARWETRAQSGLLADEAVQTFHRLAAPKLLGAGFVRLYLLSFAGQVTGAYYGLAAKRRAYAYIGGFDPAFAHESPGTILIAHAIAQAHEQGDERFEFLRGGEAYKYAWGAQDEPVYRRIWERNA
jgi:CelD/BcsL family acetyltransferase involved in cellulose biosynthesis